MKLFNSIQNGVFISLVTAFIICELEGERLPVTNEFSNETNFRVTSDFGKLESRTSKKNTSIRFTQTFSGSHFASMLPVKADGVFVATGFGSGNGSGLYYLDLIDFPE